MCLVKDSKVQSTKLESIFQEIWEHDEKQKEKGKANFNPFQKLTLGLSFLFFCIALIVALSTKISTSELQKPVALVFTFLSQTTGILYQLSFIFEASKIFKKPTRHFLRPIAKSSAVDFELAESFHKFTEQQLHYAKERISLERSHMKARVGMLVGALEKVGIIPVLVTWILASYKYIANGTITFDKIDWLVYLLLGLYVVMLPILSFAHKLERYLLLVNTALEIKADKSNQET
jgi:hypothetical protein